MGNPFGKGGMQGVGKPPMFAGPPASKPKGLKMGGVRGSSVPKAPRVTQISPGDTGARPFTPNRMGIRKMSGGRMGGR